MSQPGLSDADAVRAVQSLIRSGDLAQATRIAREALEGGQVHPLHLHLRARWFETQGRIAPALRDLQQAVAIAPGDPIAHFALGELLMQIGEPQQAATCFARAAELKPDYVPAFRMLGTAKCLIGEIDLGRRSYETAIALDPKDADSLAGLAELAQRRGDNAQAHALIDRVFAVAPGHPTANIVRAALSIAEGALDRAETEIRQLLTNNRVAPADHAIVMGQLGDLRDAQRRYGEAFQAYAAAGAAKRQMFASKYDRAGRETSHSYALWLTDFLKTAPASAWRGRRGRAAAAGSARPRQHVFVVGFPRSGTTLLHSVLSGNPDVTGMQERGLLFEGIRDFLSNDAGRARLAELGEEEIDRYVEFYWRRATDQGLDAAGKVFVDTQPLNSMQLLLVSKMFPDAKVLFAIRDPRDVVFSCFRRALAIGPSTFEFLDIERAARFYDAVMTLSRSYRDKLRLDWRDARHESLAEDFVAELNDLCAFVGIEPTAGMRDFAALAGARNISTASAAQIRRGLSNEGIGHWRHYARELAPVLPVLEPWVKRFGYPAA